MERKKREKRGIYIYIVNNARRINSVNGALGTEPVDVIRELVLLDRPTCGDTLL